ncbi:MAG: hypothetical protein OEX77_06305 [Candidatus Bathyarchaeota archaeon]|nr:hypothetical protein [Candidatus Bathyarchaeota archaeon]MDH5732961.1 hypothetical protein [Candidatus Bathyarchaeota archaeon]
MRTYLKVWYNSEGANPVVVAQKLNNMGFKAIKGQFDYVYDWRKEVELEDILQIMTAVHETLKGSKVSYKMETM